MNSSIFQEFIYRLIDLGECLLESKANDGTQAVVLVSSDPVIVAMCRAAHNAHVGDQVFVGASESVLDSDGRVVGVKILEDSGDSQASGGRS